MNLNFSLFAFIVIALSSASKAEADGSPRAACLEKVQWVSLVPSAQPPPPEVASILTLVREDPGPTSYYLSKDKNTALLYFQESEDCGSHGCFLQEYDTSVKPGVISGEVVTYQDIYLTQDKNLIVSSPTHGFNEITLHENYVDVINENMADVEEACAR